MHAELARHGVVVRPVERAAHPGLDAAGRIEQALLAGALEDGAVVVRSSEVRVPDVVVGVQVHEAERPVHRRRGAQLGERDGVVAADPERDRPAAVDRLGVGLDARQRVLDVARHGRRVAVVHARERAPDHHVLGGVVGPQERRGRAHGLGPEARARAVRRAGVPRDPEERDVDVLGRLDVRQPPERARAAVARGLECVDGLVHRRRAYSAIAMGDRRRARSALASSRITPRPPPLSATRSRASQSATAYTGSARLRSERRDAADLIPGQALGVALGGERGRARARRARQSAQRELAVAGHEREREAVVELRHERLRDHRGVQPERLGRVRGPLHAVLVAVLGELHAALAQVPHAARDRHTPMMPQPYVRPVPCGHGSGAEHAGGSSGSRSSAC